MNDAAVRGQFSVSVGGFSVELAFAVDAGRVLVLFGPSGAGKTTALRTIAGLVRPESGRIDIAGRTVFADNDDEPPCWEPPHRRGVGYVTQQNHLFPHLTVAQNIAYGLPDRRGDSAHRRVSHLIDRLQLAGLEDRRVSQLSGGQQQRTALARALAPSPDLLLLDEPFSSLDMELRRSLGAELRAAIRELDVPVIMVTHSREEALALGDTVQIIDAGRVVAEGPPLHVLEQPGQGRVARLVGVENLLRMQVAARLPQDGTMVCEAGERALETPLADGCAVGDAVTVGIRASDIILAAGRCPSHRRATPGPAWCPPSSCARPATRWRWTAPERSCAATSPARLWTPWASRPASRCGPSSRHRPVSCSPSEPSNQRPLPHREKHGNLPIRYICNNREEDHHGWPDIRGFYSTWTACWWTASPCSTRRSTSWLSAVAPPP